MPDEVSIICSSTQDNIKKLKSLSDDMGRKYEIAEVAGKGQPHKMFTFCTSTVYVGADFYSESAYSYIFANPNINSMAVDVSVDLQQIIGRQRLESNPFKNSGTLYFKTKAPRRTIEELENEEFNGWRIYHSCQFRLPSGVRIQKEYVLYHEKKNDRIYEFPIELTYNYPVIREFIKEVLSANLEDENIINLKNKYMEYDEFPWSKSHKNNVHEIYQRTLNRFRLD